MQIEMSKRNNHYDSYTYLMSFPNMTKSKCLVCIISVHTLSNILFATKNMNIKVRQRNVGQRRMMHTNIFAVRDFVLTFDLLCHQRQELQEIQEMNES